MSCSTEDKKLYSPCKVSLERINMKTPVKQLALSAELRKVINDRNILTCNARKKMLFELDQLDVERKNDEKLHTLQEILTSELAYINQIELIQEYFMKPIRQRHLLQPFEYDTLFSNINSIYQVNGALLDKLKEDLMHLTSAFNKMAPFLKLYSEYAFNFKNAMDTLDELMNKNVNFCKFVQGQETRPEVQNKLSSLLIAPIQRIPRYCLLIKQVLDNTYQKDEDYKTLEETYAKLNDVAKHIDSAVEDKENSEKLLALATMVKNGKSLIIKPGRRIIKQGIMKLFTNNKASSDIYMIVFSDIIMFCTIKKTKIDQPNSLKCLAIFPLRKCDIQQNAKMMLNIRCEEESMVVYCEEGASRAWLLVIRKAIKQYMDNRSTLRKGSSSRRPAVRFNLDSYRDHGVSPGVPGLRKRRRFTDFENKEHEDVVVLDEELPEVKRSKVLHGRKSIKSLIPKFISKPKSIIMRNIRSKSNSTATTDRASDEDSNEENVNANISVKKDALFPLRKHFLEREQNCQVNNSPSDNATTSSSVVPYPSNVFVFGRENNRKNMFTFSGIYEGFTSVFKRAFGMR